LQQITFFLLCIIIRLILSEELCPAVSNLQDRQMNFLSAEPAVTDMLAGMALLQVVRKI